MLTYKDWLDRFYERLEDEWNSGANEKHISWESFLFYEYDLYKETIHEMEYYCN